MSKQQNYTILIDELSHIIGADGAAVCGKVVGFTNSEDDVCEIKHSYLCWLLKDCSVYTLKRLLRRLHVLGYIVYKPGDGRSHISHFKRGANLIPFIEEKGVQNCTERGAKLTPIKYNKNINNACATARKRGAAQRVKEEEKAAPLKLFYNGDTNLTPEMAARAVRLKYNDRYAYCMPEDKDACIAAGAIVC